MITSVDVSIVPSRVEFNQTVCDFKTNHNIKLRDLFSKKNSYAALRHEFITDPIISAYLSRSSELVKFTDYHPSFDVKREEKKINDYYEGKIYRLAHENSLEMLFYRENVLEDSFYLSGTDTSKLSTLLTKTGQDVPEIIILPALDIYQIRERIGEFQFLKSGNIQFVLSPNDKDGHAFAIISILDQVSDRILASIFLNSWSDNDYFERMKYSFVFKGIEGFEPISRNDSKIEELYKKTKLKTQSFHIDEEKKVGYLLDIPEHRDLPETNKIRAAIREGRINVVHNLYKCREEYVYKVKDTREIPFVDCCHEVQTSGDHNCALYAFNFIQAIIDLLKSNEKAKKIYQLALQLNDCDNKKRNEAREKIQFIFKEDLKNHLSSYYDLNGLKKNKKELKEYHLKLRWNLGSRAVRDLEHLQTIGFF